MPRMIVYNYTRRAANSRIALIEKKEMGVK